MVLSGYFSTTGFIQCKVGWRNSSGKLLQKKTQLVSDTLYTESLDRTSRRGIPVPAPVVYVSLRHRVRLELFLCFHIRGEDGNEEEAGEFKKKKT